MAGWWEWGQYKRQKRERKATTREIVERSIAWELPAHLLPIRCKKLSFKSYRDSFCWYVAGSSTPNQFVYVLKEWSCGAVRYVGVTNDPPRRYQEHRRAGILNGRFQMVIIAEGGIEIEQQLITKFSSEGCDLLNVTGDNANGA